VKDLVYKERGSPIFKSRFRIEFAEVYHVVGKSNDQGEAPVGIVSKQEQDQEEMYEYMEIKVGRTDLVGRLMDYPFSGLQEKVPNQMGKQKFDKKGHLI
jgi:hypothetical protein